MRSPTPPSKKYTNIRNGLVTSIARLNKSTLRMPPRRLALILLSSIFITFFFFIIFLSASGALSSSTPPPPKAPFVVAPRPLINVLTEQGALHKVGDNTDGKVSRVLIVTMEIGFSSPGGIGTAYTGLALALVEKGHNVTILFVDDNRHTREEWMTILAPLDGLGLKVQYIDPLALTGCYYSCQRSYRIYRWLRQHEDEFDVIHFHDNGGPAFFSTRAKSQGLAFKNSVLCVGAHGPHMWVLEWNRETVDSLVHLEVDEMERSSVALSDAMISPSAYMPQWMSAQGWTLPPQSYVHPNILPASIDENTKEVKDALLSAATRVPVKEFVFFGRLERRKGLWIFLDALDLIWNEDPQAFDNMIITFLGRDTVFRDPTKKNKETRASQEIENHCAIRGWNCIYMLNMDHVGAIRYLRYQGIVAVMPSPMDNSPNVVSECLMYSIPFVAFKVGGIPELIKAEDRNDVLSEPDADSLSVKLLDIMKNGAYRARIGMESETRAQVWVDWHLAAQSSPSYSFPFAPVSPSAPSPSITICVLYNPEKWGNNLAHVVNSVRAQDHFARSSWEILVLVKSVAVEEGIDLNMAEPLKMRVIRHKLDESDIVQLYAHAASHATTKYVLLLDPVSWLNAPTQTQTQAQTQETQGYANALRELAGVAERTDAQIVTAQAMLNDSTNSILLHIGSVGMYSSIVNCIGDWNMLAEREAYLKLLPFDRGDDIWRVYARAMMAGYRLESVPEPYFYQSIRISRDVDHRNTLEVNREFRPLFVRPYDTLVMVTQGFIKTKRLHDIEEEALRHEYESMAKQLEQYKAARDEKYEKFSPLVPSLKHAKFFFVRGFEKSGTTWLRDVIGLHPAVYLSRWEFHFEIMSRAVNSFTTKPWQAFYNPYKNVTQQWWLDFVPALLASGVPEEIHSDVQWIGEKTPGALEPVIPGAKYVTIIRDGRDVAVSLFFHYANLGGFQGFCPLGYLVNGSDLTLYKENKTYFDTHADRLMALEPCVRMVARMWVERVKSDLEVTDKLNAEMERSAHIVHYEDLIASCETEREKIYRFLDLDPADANPLSRTGWTLPGFGEGKTNRNLFYRKGISGDWKNYMTEEQKTWFKEEAGETLIKLGYETDDNW